MTKMFGNLNTDNLESTGDRLGGGRTIESDVYTGATVKLAYAGKAANSNAQSITYHIDINGFELRETQWITNRNGENFWTDKNDATKNYPLPGFTTIDDLCLLTTGHGLTEQDFEEKVVKLYDFDQRKELPQNVQVISGVIGKKISLAVLKQIVDKNVKQGDQYVPSGDTREENIVDKFFHDESGRTVTEIREGLEEAVFMGKWQEKNKGKTKNKAKGAQGNTGAPGRPSGGASSSNNTKPQTSLFGSK